MDRNDLPIGFSLALGQNPEAMKAFSNFPAEKQTEILNRAQSIVSKSEMQELVNGLSAQGS